MFDKIGCCSKEWPHEAASREATCGRPAARTASSCAPGAAHKRQQLQVPRQRQRQLQLRVSVPGDCLGFGARNMAQKGLAAQPPCPCLQLFSRLPRDLQGWARGSRAKHRS